MTPAVLLTVGIEPALQLLPPFMDSPSARAMLLAIGLQESRLTYRRQQAGGPARGYYQFELSGIHGVLSHSASSDYAHGICVAMDITPAVGTVSDAIVYNDVLASAFARLLLWTLPEHLPTFSETEEGWRQYLKAWRPGTPRPETWPTYYAEGWGHAPLTRRGQRA